MDKDEIQNLTVLHKQLWPFMELAIFACKNSF